MTAISSTLELQDFELPDSEFDTASSTNVNDEKKESIDNAKDDKDEIDMPLPDVSESEQLIQESGQGESFHEDEVKEDAKEPLEDSIENKFSFERWKTLRMRTTEMRQVALSCPAMLSNPIGDDVIKRLNGLVRFLEDIEEPCPEDFEFVDQRMQHLMTCLEKAMDSYMAERRENNNGIYARLCSIIKGVAACSVLVGVVAVVGEFVSLD